MTRRALILIAALLIGCVPARPKIQEAAPVPISQRSKLSVHIGNRPSGLDGFLETAHPTVIYSLNNSPMAEIRDHSPQTLLIRRIQNDTWDRLPDCMYCGLGTDHWESDARASARYEALYKLQYVPGRGPLNYVNFVKLAEQDFVAGINEPVLGNSGDYLDKARWLNAWTEEWLTVIHAYGLHGSIFSFPTGEPALEAVPYLTGAARLAAENGDIIDVHEYGIEGALMTSPSSGAFGFVRFHDALPADARPRFDVSEFSAGNGYDTGLTGNAWIADSLAYGLRLREYPYLIGATAFQLDLGAESNIPQDVLEDYADALSRVDWSMPFRLSIYLPVVLN